MWPKCYEDTIDCIIKNRTGGLSKLLLWRRNILFPVLIWHICCCILSLLQPHWTWNKRRLMYWQHKGLMIISELLFFNNTNNTFQEILKQRQYVLTLRKRLIQMRFHLQRTAYMWPNIVCWSSVFQNAHRINWENL